MVDYSGYQSLPTGETVSMEPATGGLEAGSAMDPMLAAYFKKIGLDPAMAATLSADDMKRMAYSAREDAYNTAMQADLQRSGKLQRIGTTYAEANPQDYYNTFGTIPLQSLGKSRFGVTDAGALDTKEGAEGIKYLTPDANATYTLYSPRSGQTLGTGTGAEGLLALTQMAQNQTANKDRKADWQLLQTPAGGGAPEVIGSNLYNTNLSGFGKIVAGALPIAASFIPGLNFLGPTLGPMLNAGVAGGLSAAMKEQNILNGALRAAAVAGVMNAPVLPGGGSLAQSIGTVINKVPGLGDVTQALGKIGSGAASKAVGDEIVVNAARNIAPALANAGVQAGAQGALNNLTQGPEPRRPDYGDKVEEPQNTDNEIVVTGGRAPALPGNLAASVINQFAPSLNAPTTQTTPTTTDANKTSTVDKVIGGLKLAGLIAPFLGGGSGNSNTLGAFMPSGGGASNPLYSAKLPTPGVNGAFQVGGMGANSGAMPVPVGGDYTRFGMGNAPMSVAPADIPQYGGVNPAGFNPDTMEWLGPQPVKKAMGGYAVGGPGTGRSDEIPAMLSDGEYVIDAETVALLGDGSNKAGAKALDKFRANIRKQKGRKLAQGKFSVKAKQPEAYLSGGR